MKITIEVTASEAAKILTLASESHQTIAGTLHKLVSTALERAVPKKVKRNKYPCTG